MKDIDAQLMMEAYLEGPEDQSFFKRANPVSVARWIISTTQQGFSDDNARNDFYNKLKAYVDDAGSGVNPVDPKKVLKQLYTVPFDHAGELEAAIAYIKKFEPAEDPELTAAIAKGDREREDQQYGSLGGY